MYLHNYAHYKSLGHGLSLMYINTKTLPPHINLHLSGFLMKHRFSVVFGTKINTLIMHVIARELY